jgi:hypothetical protein
MKITQVTIYQGLVILFIASSLILGTKLDSKQKALNKANIDYVNLKNEKPKEIIVHDNNVQYVYEKGKVVTKYKVPEGYVKFDVEKYTSIQTKLDSLMVVNVNAKAKLADLQKTNGVLNKQVSVKDTLLQDYEDVIRDTDRQIAELQASLNKPETLVTIHNRGFTLRPEIGFGYDGKADGYIGIKWAYWNRYSLSVGSTSKQVGIGVARHIDDIVPFTHNAEITVMYGYPYKKSDGSVFVGVKTGL